LSSVPAGQYDLVVDVSAHVWTRDYWSDGTGPAQDVPVSITIAQGGGFTGNFMFALFLIFLWPGVVTGLHWSFDSRRRQQSSRYAS
jgi:hypothetical protein